MNLDRDQQFPGYWPSPWAVECGGNRRQKASGQRLDATPDAKVILRENGRWNVMIIRRDPEEWFLQGTMAAFNGPPPFGWVERIDCRTLEPLATSPQLPCGDHVWCGSILAHADGTLLTVNGNYVHCLNTNCEVIGERRLPIDQAHNGLLALSDGTLITKDLRLEDQGPSSMTLMQPGSLEIIGKPIALPEGSMGRLAADWDGRYDWIYVTGTEHVFRYRWDGARLVHDPNWQPRYRHRDGDHGLAWDSCLSGGMLWLMDNGDIPSAREIFQLHPNGRLMAKPTPRFSWKFPVPWNGAQRLHRIDCNNDQNISTATPFATPGGAVMAPPVHVPEVDVTVMWDTLHGGLAGLRASAADLDTVWECGVRPTMQPVVFPESGELVTNDYTDDGSDELLVIDLASGKIKSRIATGSGLANGMFLTAGDQRDVYYCTNNAVVRVSWE